MNATTAREIRTNVDDVRVYVTVFGPRDYVAHVAHPVEDFSGTFETMEMALGWAHATITGAPFNPVHPALERDREAQYARAEMGYMN